MKFTARIRTPQGTIENRSIEAASRYEVYTQIEHEGCVVEEVSQSSTSSIRRILSWLTAPLFLHVTAEERIVFVKNLAAMLGAGLTLSRSLAVIERQTANPKLKEITAGLAASVKKGTSFHESLAAYPALFSALFIAMAKAGEESGTLVDSLRAVAVQMERSHALTKKIRGAMIYPVIILLAVVVIGVLMLIYVVPTLAKTFKGLGVKLPATTQVILSASDFAVHNAALLALIGILLLVAAITFFRSHRGKQLLLWIALRLPVIRTLVRETYGARATRTMASLLGSGVEVLTALSIAKEVVGDNVFAGVIEEAETRVRKGDALSAAFTDHPKLYPPFVGEMVAVGEETGKVAEMFGQVASYYEDDVEEQTKDLSTVIEPVVMLFIGVVVGVFAISMIAPIYSLSSAF